MLISSSESFFAMGVHEMKKSVCVYIYEKKKKTWYNLSVFVLLHREVVSIETLNLFEMQELKGCNKNIEEIKILITKDNKKNEFGV